MSRALTVRSVETIKSGSKRVEIPDRHMPGLYLVVQPTGAKSWAIRYRHQGETRKHTLGAYPKVGLKDARELAGKALRMVAEGKDPAQEKARQREADDDNVVAVAEKFLRLHCTPNNRPRTAAETGRLLKSHVLPRWKRRQLHEIRRRDVIELLDRIVEAGSPIAANRVLSAVRKMCNWAVARDIIPASPCDGVEPPSEERARDRVLSDDELRNVWHATDQLGYPVGTLVKLLILTGQRRDEVAGMRRSELDLDAVVVVVEDGKVIKKPAPVWKLPAGRVKNDKGHDVPVSQAALNVLAGLPRIGDEFVLTTSGTAPASGYARGKRRLDALLPTDMPPWRLHDLRRTAATGMARLGVNLPVIEKVLNHASGSFAGIVGVYQKHDFAGEKRAALEAWGRHVLTLSPDRTVKHSDSLANPICQ